MKVKSLLLPMLVITALASCSQNDIQGGDGTNAGKGTSSKVFLKIVGEPVAPTRAGEAVGGPTQASASESQIKDVHVFFFNQEGHLILRPEYRDMLTTPDTDEKYQFKTTTDATQVVVIANAGGNQTGATGLFGKVKDLNTLKAVDYSLLQPGTGTTAGQMLVNQTSSNLTASGMGTITGGDGSEASSRRAEVPLHFLAAKIKEINITYKIPSINGHTGSKYWPGSENDFKTIGVSAASLQMTHDSRWKNFMVTKVFLLTAQTKSSFLPESEGAWGNGFKAPGEYVYASGIAYKGEPFVWDTTKGTEPVNTGSYLLGGNPAKASFPIESIKDLAGNGVQHTTMVEARGYLGNVLKNNPWYVFENKNDQNIPTGIVIETLYKTKVSPDKGPNPTDVDFIKKEWFTVYFGSKAGQEPLEAGKSYSITINLNADYQLYTGGGGTVTPQIPTTEANVTVTVSKADWVIASPITKDFGNEIK